MIDLWSVEFLPKSTTGCLAHICLCVHLCTCTHTQWSRLLGSETKTLLFTSITLARILTFSHSFLSLSSHRATQRWPCDASTHAVWNPELGIPVFSTGKKTCPHLCSGERHDLSLFQSSQLYKPPWKESAKQGSQCLCLEDMQKHETRGELSLTVVHYWWTLTWYLIFCFY